MISKIIEATNTNKFNFGKFNVSVYDAEERSRASIINEGFNLLRSIGKHPDDVMVADLQTSEALTFPAYFRNYRGGDPERLAGEVHYYMGKHKIWVCPLYEPFVCWLFEQDLEDIRKLPPMVDTLPEEVSSLFGYRRQGNEPEPVPTAAKPRKAGRKKVR